MSLPVPGLSVPGFESKHSIEELINQSVFRFEAKLSGFGVLTMAKAAGWIDEYRKELAGIAAAARSAK